ncbi:MAG: GAF domain-containing protein [Sphingomicrobium sp.]
MSSTSSTASLERPEPATTGSIQPLGWLALVSSEWLVERISANIGDYFGQSAEAVIGRPLADLLGGDAVHGLRNQLALLRAPDSIARLFGCAAGPEGERFDVSIHLDGQHILIEAQRASGIEHGDTIATIRALVGRLDESPGLAPMLDQAARHLRALTGFDRVAIYCGAGGAPASLAAHASRTQGAIPDTLTAADYDAVRAAPAVIADRDAEPVAMVPPGPLAGSLIRAPDGATRERLRAAGAAASLHFPLKVAGADWGLIVCHSPRARVPTAERLSALGLYAQMLGLLIDIRELRGT